MFKGGQNGSNEGLSQDVLDRSRDVTASRERLCSLEEKKKRTKRLIFPRTGHGRFKTMADTEKYFWSMVSWTGPGEILDLWKSDLFKEREIFMNTVEDVMQSKGLKWEAASVALCSCRSVKCGRSAEAPSESGEQLADSAGCKNI